MSESAPHPSSKDPFAPETFLKLFAERAISNTVNSWSGHHFSSLWFSIKDPETSSKSGNTSSLFGN